MRETEIFVSFHELDQHGIKFCRIHLRRLIAKGSFPPAVRLSQNRIAWRFSDLEAWKASRPIAEPKSAHAA